MGNRKQVKLNLIPSVLIFTLFEIMTIFLEIFSISGNGGFGVFNNKIYSSLFIYSALNTIFFLIVNLLKTGCPNNIKYKNFMSAAIFMTFVIQSGSFLSVTFIFQKSNMTYETIDDIINQYSKQIFIITVFPLIIVLFGQFILKFVEKHICIFTVIVSSINYILAALLIICKDTIVSGIALGLIILPLSIADTALVSYIYYDTKSKLNICQLKEFLSKSKWISALIIFSIISILSTACVSVIHCHETGITAVFSVSLLAAFLFSPNLLFKDAASKTKKIILAATALICIITVGFFSLCLKNYENEYGKCIENNIVEMGYFCSNDKHDDAESIEINHPKQISFVLLMGSKVSRIKLNENKVPSVLTKSASAFGNPNYQRFPNASSDYSLALSIRHMGMVWFFILVTAFCIFIFFGGIYFSQENNNLQFKLSSLSFFNILVMTAYPLLSNTAVKIPFTDYIVPIIGVSPYASGLSITHTIICSLIMGMMLLNEC